jgi:predicted phage-related endonuclease
VYADKVGVPSADRTSGPAEIGNAAEPVLIGMLEARLGTRIERNPPTIVHPNGIFAVNLDGRLPTGAIVEAKSTGLTDEYGQPGTDEVSDRTLAQVMYQMFVSDARYAYVPVLLLDFCPRVEVYEVPYDADLAEMIEARCMEFWTKHVVPRVPPPLSQHRDADSAALSRIVRSPGSIRECGDAALFEQLEAAKAARKAAEQEEEAIRLRLLATMGDAEALRAPDGTMYTYLEQSRSCLDSARLRAEMPDVFDRFNRSSKFRVLRRKAAKK